MLILQYVVTVEIRSRLHNYNVSMRINNSWWIALVSGYVLHYNYSSIYIMFDIHNIDITIGSSDGK